MKISQYGILSVGCRKYKLSVGEDREGLLYTSGSRLGIVYNQFVFYRTHGCFFRALRVLVNTPALGFQRSLLEGNVPWDGIGARQSFDQKHQYDQRIDRLCQLLTASGIYICRIQMYAHMSTFPEDRVRPPRTDLLQLINKTQAQWR